MKLELLKDENKICVVDIDSVLSPETYKWVIDITVYFNQNLFKQVFPSKEIPEDINEILESGTKYLENTDKEFPKYTEYQVKDKTLVNDIKSLTTIIGNRMKNVSKQYSLDYFEH